MSKQTIADLAPHVGKQGILTVKIWNYKLKVPIIIKNVEIIYGKACYTVEPVGGSGQARVNDGSLEIQQ